MANEVVYNGHAIWPISIEPPAPAPGSLELLGAEMLAEASHEIKTPLSSIQNSLLLLRVGALGKLPPDVEDTLRVVERNAVRLMNLVESILDMEQLRQGTGRLSLQSVALGELINEAINVLYTDSARRRVQVQLSVTNIWIEADSEKLMRVFINLLSNAIKFSPAGETVEISVTQEEKNMVCIAISDRGPGVCPDDSERIFNKFEQTSAGKGRGTGLGLAIARKIVEHHGGSIGVSGRPGGGSVFWVRLQQASSEIDMDPNSDRAA